MVIPHVQSSAWFLFIIIFMRYICCSQSILSIPVSPFHRLMSGDLTQFIQRPLFLEFWLVSDGCPLYPIRNGSPDWWRFVTDRDDLSPFASSRRSSVVLQTYANVCGAIILEQGILLRFFCLFICESSRSVTPFGDSLRIGIRHVWINFPHGLFINISFKTMDTT